MESLLKKILEKKRSERSSSGESSTSPDAKKAKSGDVNFPEVEEQWRGRRRNLYSFEHGRKPSQNTGRDKSKVGKAGYYSNNSERCSSVSSETGRKNTEVGMLSNNRQPRHWEPDRKLQSGRKATTKICGELKRSSGENYLCFNRFAEGKRWSTSQA